MLIHDCNFWNLWVVELEFKWNYLYFPLCYRSSKICETWNFSVQFFSHSRFESISVFRCNMFSPLYFFFILSRAFSAFYHFTSVLLLKIDRDEKYLFTQHPKKTYLLNEQQFFTKKILEIIENVLLMFTLTVRDIQEMLNYRWSCWLERLLVYARLRI